MKRFFSLVLGLSFLGISLVLTSCGITKKDTDSTNIVNENIEQSVSGSASVSEGATQKEFPPLYELLQTGIIYKRDDVSEEFWNAKKSSGYTNEESINQNFEILLDRPFMNDYKLQIPQTLSYYLKATDMYRITINKDNLFYLRDCQSLNEGDDR